VATREDRVCVLNILGGESSDVTPVGHVYSGGNVVFGTAPGKRGQVLETTLGAVPVFTTTYSKASRRPSLQLRRDPTCRRQRRVMVCRTDPGQSGVEEDLHRHGEARRHDSREIRAMGPANGIDIFRW